MKISRFSRWLGLILAAAMLAGCAPQQPSAQLYSATYLDVFDTVTTLKGPAETEALFQELSDALHEELLYHHKLFDIYNEYDGMTNLKTVNDRAALAPVTVEPAILQLLLDCRSYYELTGGKVNAAMGSVLRLWHDARTAAAEDPESAALPDPEALREAAAHTDFDSVILDEEASTVFFTDPQLRLDVGAIAKGWTAQRVSRELPEGVLLSVGGNVLATGPKPGSGAPWVVAVQKPDLSAEGYLATVELDRGSMVTSGDYQRYFTVDGVRYHHIIDPDTRFPSRYWSSVTIRCADSGLADALSTALFVMDLDAGQALLEKTGAEALWLTPDGEIFASPGFTTRENIGKS